MIVWPSKNGPAGLAVLTTANDGAAFALVNVQAIETAGAVARVSSNTVPVNKLGVAVPPTPMPEQAMEDKI